MAGWSRKSDWVYRFWSRHRLPLLYGRFFPTGQSPHVSLSPARPMVVKNGFVLSWISWQGNASDFPSHGWELPLVLSRSFVHSLRCDDVFNYFSFAGMGYFSKISILVLETYAQNLLVLVRSCCGNHSFDQSWVSIACPSIIFWLPCFCTVESVTSQNIDSLNIFLKQSTLIITSTSWIWNLLQEESLLRIPVWLLVGFWVSKSL